MLSAERNHDGWIFRALALVDGRRVGQHQLIQLAKAVIDVAAVEIDAELAFLHIDARHDAEVAIVDVLVVIVLDLHDLVARTEGPAEALDADLARRVQSVLKLDIHGAGTEAAAVHRAEHLDVAYLVKSETVSGSGPAPSAAAFAPLFRLRFVNEIEIAPLVRGEIFRWC